MSGAVTQFGWLDANVFVHPLFRKDPHAVRCRGVLEALLTGTGEGWIDPVTLHELTYVLPRALPQRFNTQQDVFDYLMGFLTCDTVLCDDKESLIEGLRLWLLHGIRFGDARLLALAKARGMAVCTVNIKDFPGVAHSLSEDTDS